MLHLVCSYHSFFIALLVFTLTILHSSNVQVNREQSKCSLQIVVAILYTWCTPPFLFIIYRDKQTPTTATPAPTKTKSILKFVGT